MPRNHVEGGQPALPAAEQIRAYLQGEIASYVETFGDEPMEDYDRGYFEALVSVLEDCCGLSPVFSVTYKRCEKRSDG